MGYRSLADCVEDLKRTGRLVTIDREVDPRLEAAAIQRRVYEAGGPALLFPRVKGSAFPLVANLFGTRERTHHLFRDTLEAVRHLVELKVKPPAALARPWRYRDVPFTALHLLPRKVRRGPILAHKTTLSRLPHVVSWPDDGGAFVTLPQVYSEDPDHPGLAKSNLGMYRVQLSGNQYEPDRETGLHYQIHRGIGVHHSAGDPPGRTAPGQRVRRRPALDERRRRDALARRACPELSFAGALGGRRVRMVVDPEGGLPIPAEADFAIVGTIDPEARKPEGPFGDHLGYYSLDPRLPGPPGRAGLPPDRRDLAVHLGRPPSAGRYLVRRADPRADRPARPDRPARESTRSTRSTRRGSTRSCWPSAASGTCPMPRSDGLRNC